MEKASYPSRQTIAYWVRRHAELQPKKVAIKNDGKEVTYGQLHERTDRLAHALAAKGVGAGHRVAVLLNNRLEGVETFLACAKLGAICVPLNFRLSQEELSGLVKDAGASVLLYEKAWGKVVDELKQHLTEPGLTVGLEDDAGGQVAYEAFLASGADEPVKAALDVNEETAALIMYTAGSTGVPKGVVLTQGNVYWQCQNALMMGILPNVVALAVLPFFHVGGLLGSAVPVLLIGGRLIIQTRFDVDECLRIIEEEGVVGMVGVPAIYQFLAGSPKFKEISFVDGSVFTSGGAPMPVSLIKTYAERGVTFRQGYGLTEASAGVTFMYAEDALAKPGSVGRPCFYTQVEVVSDAGKPVAAGEQGEIVVHGPNVMREYWKRPEATAETLKDRWLYTGDVGKFDEEGYLYLTDRKKDMIISGGENIFPAEIQKLLSDHPEVKECTVLGAPDPKWGERVVAVVVAAKDKAPTLEEVRAYLGEKLARYKLPREVKVMEALPRNAAGKVIKKEVRKELGLENSLSGASS